jgi:hypothetical protein
MNKQYSLGAYQALRQVEDILHLESQPSMEDVAPDVAFQLGWETALYHLREALGPDPLEIELHTFRIVELEDEEFPIHKLPETD